MKRLMAITVATVFVASGCGYLNAWRNGGCTNCYDSYDDAVVYSDDHGYSGGQLYGDDIIDEGQYPVYMPGDGAVLGPEMIVPGETVPAPAGEPLPGPARQ